MRQASLLIRPKNPQADSNCLSKLTFWYTLKIFEKAWKRELDEDDLTQPLKEHQSALLGEKLAIVWAKEIEYAKERSRTPKLQGALFTCFKWPIIKFSIVATVLEMVVRISQPLFLKLLLRYYSRENMNKVESGVVEQPRYSYILRIFHVYNTDQGMITMEEAAFFTFGVILSSWLVVAISHPYLIGVMHLGMKMRIACCSLIYRKALCMKLDLAGTNMIGNVVNLLSNDVNRFDNGIMFLSYIVLTPVQIAFITYFIYMEVGFAAVYGIIALISVIPLQLWLAVKVLTLRYETAVKTDARVKELNELIQAIQVIKMYTWEEVFMKIIHKHRREEIKLLEQMGFIKGVVMSFIIISFRFSIFITAVATVLLTDEITGEKIFVVTAFLLILRQTVTQFFPQTLAQGAELMVSLWRLEEFLLLDEAAVGDPTPMKPNYFENSANREAKIARLASFPPGGLLKVTGASVEIKGEVILSNVSFEMFPGHLTVIIGPVGAGKTCLLHLILGELVPKEGDVDVRGVISYASQEPWLFDGTIRQNILFGRDFNRKRYEEVCFVCALHTDFKWFPQGDKTIVGEKGSGLSGGQRARINLARAIYKEADIYLLDDPLSAVDANVGQHLFEECIDGYLSDKIVVLVTHQLQYLEDADQIILMKDGVIEITGDYEELKQAGLDFSVLLAEQLVDPSTQIEKTISKEIRTSLHKALADISRKNLATVTFIDKENQKPAKPRLIKEVENLERVDMSVYKEYFRAGSNFCGNFVMFSLFILTQLSSSGADFFISTWIDVEEHRTATNEHLLSRNACIWIYTGVIILTMVIALVRSIYFFHLCMVASLNLHNSMFKGVVETRMNFFYHHSSGDILNRFSKDMGAVDEILPNGLIDTLQILLNLIGVIVVVVIINPYFLIPTLFICVLFYYMRNCYLRISDNIKRLEDMTKSPVFTHISSTLQGLATIRSNGAEKILTMEFDRHQDVHSSAWFIFISTSRAFGYWLDNVCMIYMMLISFSFLLVPSNSGKVGLAITQSIGLTGLFQWGLRQSVEVENQMVSVERVIEYAKLEPEPNLKSDPAKGLPHEWPTSGKVEFAHAFMKYGPQDANVLKDVNFVIEDKEKIGVVGRTGAGKSSLIAALFRLAYFYGEVRIDNVDISQLCLHDLRKKISIIPQEPVLFNGTLQYNLDPFDEYDANRIFKILIDLENKDAVLHGKSCLEHMIVEGGINVSIGQRQVICLARALLKDNKIVVMDEATANIDAKTDKFIQSVIRTKFSHCTVITIAHRLHTIMDSDKVLVMDAGQVAEFDHPHILLQNSAGIFTGMVERTGEHMADSLKNIASQTFKNRSTSSS